jgi:HEAT repeat protein
MQTSTKCYILVAVVVVAGSVYGGLYWWAGAKPWTGLAARMLSPETRAEKLVGKLADPDHSWDAEVALVNMGDRAMPGLIECLDDDSWEMRVRAARELGYRGDLSAVPVMIECLSDEDQNVRCGAAQALGDLGDPSAVPALVEQLSDEDEYLRSNAAKALAKLGDPSAVPALVKLLDSEDARVRRYAAETLGWIWDSSAVPVVSVGGCWVRFYVAQALDGIRHAATCARRVEVLTHQDASLREWAAQELGEIGHASAIPELEKLLNDEEERVRKTAEEAIAEIRAANHETLAN